jgi:hypothetical protein
MISRINMQALRKDNKIVFRFQGVSIGATKTVRKPGLLVETLGSSLAMSLMLLRVDRASHWMGS